MKTKTVERLLKEMENDPWHVKLKHWWRVKLWVWMCKTRWIWDSDYQHNVFKKKKKMDLDDFMKLVPNETHEQVDKWIEKQKRDNGNS